jgi:hypothetical protein
MIGIRWPFMSSFQAFVFALAPLVLSAAPGAVRVAPDHGRIPEPLRQLPFSFERAGNGTWMAHGALSRVNVSSAGATVSSGPTEIRMSFLGARSDAEATPQDPLPGKFNYLIGPDPARWIRDQQTFGRVRYHNVYDGVDVAWYGSEGGLEYDLAVAPGADTSRIGIRFDGVGKLAIDTNGDLCIETPEGPLTMHVPVVYQEAAGGRTRVQARYVLRAGNEVGFELAAYDKSRPLVIDPTLVYAAWFPSQNLSVNSMATDTQGNMYVGGSAAWIPTLNAVQADLYPNEPYIIKFDPTGTTMLYATFVGGTGDTLSGLAVDSTGNVVATGEVALGGNFPTVNPAQSTCGSQYDPGYCGFVFRLNSFGNGLVYATYMTSLGNAVAVDTGGNAYVTGTGFVNKYAPNGTVQYTSTLTGGAAITADPQGFAYIAGSIELPAFQGVPGVRSVGSGDCGYNSVTFVTTECAFVAKLSADGTALSWAAVLGGSGTQAASAIARDPNSGVVYIAGSTSSTDLPVTAGVIQPTAGGQGDGFLASIAADGSSFGFITYLGGSSNDDIYAMTLTSDGHIVVAGDTSSPDFPVSSAVQPAIGGNAVSLFGTTDSGNTWTAMGAGLPASNYQGLTAEGLSVDPTNPAVIVAATGEGLFRTINGGVSWSPVGAPGSYVSWLPILSRSIANPEVLYAVLFSGPVYRSVDDGATWTAGPYIDGAQSIVSASPTDANTVTVLDEWGNVYISTDGGTTFGFNPVAHVGIPAGGPVASPDGSIYLPITNGYYNGVSGGIIKSTDNGHTWNILAGSPFNNAVNTPLMSVCAASPDVLYLANYSHLYRSDNAGLAWSKLNFAYNVADAPSNCQVVYDLGSPFGLQVSTNSGLTWSSASGNLTASQFDAMAVDPTNPAHAWVAPIVLQHGFAAKISNDGKTVLWSTFYGGSNSEDVRGVIVDLSGNTWIAGSSSSTDLPLTTGLEPTQQQNIQVLFLAEISDATAACSYYPTPPSVVSYGAGIVNFGLTAPSGCTWTAIPSDNWISPVNPSAGSASATIAAVLAANNTGATRTGTITVGTQAFTITQASSTCQYSVDNSFFVLPTNGGQVTVNVTAGAGCPWSVVPGGLTVVSGGSATGNGSVTLSAPANGGMKGVAYTALVGPTTITVTVAENCTYSLMPLSIDGSVIEFGIAVTPSSSACWWAASTNSTWLAVSTNTNLGSGTIDAYGSTNRTGAPRTANIIVGSQTFTVTQSVDTLPQYTLTVTVNPPWAGTAGPGGLYDSGADVCLSATPAKGWQLSSWSGAALDSSNCLTVTSNTTVNANFGTAAQFNDVPPTATYFDAANLMFLAGVTTGCVQSTDPATRQFCPGETVTREEMAAFIVRAVTGTVTPTIYNPTPYFQDVPNTNPFFPHIQKLMDLGITTGCSQSPALFCPTNVIPRWEMAMFLVRARLALYGASFTYNPTPYFADVPTNVEGNGMPFPFIQRSYDENITNGCGTNPLIYCPDTLVTRGQMASFIMRGLFNETMVIGPTAPFLTTASPNWVLQTTGSQITVTITGVNTSFQSGDTITVPSGMLAVSNVVVNSATSISATLTVNGNAVVGPQALVVTTGGQNITLPLAIKVGSY